MNHLYSREYVSRTNNNEIIRAVQTITSYEHVGDKITPIYEYSWDHGGHKSLSVEDFWHRYRPLNPLQLKIAEIPMDYLDDAFIFIYKPAYEEFMQHVRDFDAEGWFERVQPPAYLTISLHVSDGVLLCDCLFQFSSKLFGCTSHYDLTLLRQSKLFDTSWLDEHLPKLLYEIRDVQLALSNMSHDTITLSVIEKD